MKIYYKIKNSIKLIDDFVNGAHRSTSEYDSAVENLIQQFSNYFNFFCNFF